MKNDRLRELQKEWAKQKQEEEREIETNPLSQYSTTQLKKELRRRKAER